jgi:hypothetical protein
VTVLWALGEQWVYQRHKGRKWLIDILSAFTKGALGWIPVNWLSGFGGVLFGIVRSLTILPFTRCIRWSRSRWLRRPAQHQPQTALPVVFQLVVSTLSIKVDEHTSEGQRRLGSNIVQFPLPPVREDHGIKASEFWYSSDDANAVELHHRERQGHFDIIRLAIFAHSKYPHHVTLPGISLLPRR